MVLGKITIAKWVNDISKDSSSRSNFKPENTSLPKKQNKKLSENHKSSSKIT